MGQIQLVQKTNYKDEISKPILIKKNLWDQSGDILFQFFLFFFK